MRNSRDRRHGKRLPTPSLWGTVFPHRILISWNRRRISFVAPTCATAAPGCVECSDRRGRLSHVMG